MSYSLFRPVPKGQMRDTENFLNAAVQMELVKDFKLDAGLTMAFSILRISIILLVLPVDSNCCHEQCM